MDELVKLGSAMITTIDIITDIFVLDNWYKEGHVYWFIIGLSIVLLSDVFEGLVVCSEGFQHGLFHLSGFGTVYEVVRWWRSERNEDDEGKFMMTKIFECVFEAGPFLCLQTYTMFIKDDYSQFTITSLVFSFISVGYIVVFVHSEFEGRLITDSWLIFLLSLFVAIVDAFLRVASVTLILKLLPSILFRTCFCVGFFMAYAIPAVFFCSMDDQFFSLIGYPVMNIHYDEFEMVCRHIVSGSGLTFAYTRDAIGEIELVLGLFASSSFIFFSCWSYAHQTDDQGSQNSERANEL